MNDFIQLEKDNIFRVGIKDASGNPTGECLEFDLEDIELPLKLNKSAKMHDENLQSYRNQCIIIDKKKDEPGKYILSKNEEKKIYALKEFYRREIQALDLFLGENGTKKLLNGRRPYYGMYDEFSRLLEPIMPKLNIHIDDIEKKIKDKYSPKEEENILE